MTVLQTVVEGAEPSRATTLTARGVTSSMPVSDTVGPGAKPGEAANFLWSCASTNKEQTPSYARSVYVERIEQSNCAGAEPQLAGDQRAHARGGVLPDGHGCRDSA